MNDALPFSAIRRTVSFGQPGPFFAEGTCAFSRSCRSVDRCSSHC
jgi:hypothetical protein